MSIQPTVEEENIIDELHADSIDKNSIFVFIGRRKSGKTIGLMHLMRKLRHEYHYVRVYSGSKKTLREYEEFIPGVFAFDRFDPKEFEEIYIEQEKHFMRTGKRMWVVLDDFGFDKSVLNSKIFRRILMNARHAGITLALTLQDPVSLEGVGVRNQIDYVVLAYEKAPKIRKRLYDMFDVGFGTLSRWNKAFDALTEDRSMMVLVNSQTKKRTLAASVFWMQPEVEPVKDANGVEVLDSDGTPLYRIPAFRFAPHSIIWPYHQSRFDRQHTDDKPIVPLHDKDGGFTIKKAATRRKKDTHKSKRKRHKKSKRKHKRKSTKLPISNKRHAKLSSLIVKRANTGFEPGKFVQLMV
jgi:hypothetical protein